MKGYRVANNKVTDNSNVHQHSPYTDQVVFINRAKQEFNEIIYLLCLEGVELIDRKNNKWRIMHKYLHDRLHDLETIQIMLRLSNRDLKLF